MKPTAAPGASGTPPDNRGRLVLALLYGAALLLAVVNVAAAAGLWRELAAADTPSGVDFVALFTGGELLAEKPRLLYDLNAQSALEEQLVAPNHLTEGALPFAYPPIVAAAVAPLTRLGYRQAYAAFGWFNLALLGAAVASLMARGRLSRSGAVWLATCAAASVPASFTVIQGQVSLVALLVTTWFAFDLRDGRAVRAGFWIGLLSFKPQLVPVPLLVLAAGRQWRALGAAALTSFAAWAIFLPRIGRSALAGYADIAGRLASADGTLGVHPERMFNLRALALAALGGTSGRASDAMVAVALALAAAALVLAGTVWLTLRRPDGVRSPHLLWALPVGMLLVSPHVNLHDLSLLLLPAGALLGADGRGVSPRTAALAVGLAALPVPAVLGGSGAAASVAAVPAVLLAGFLVGVRRAGRA